MKHEKLLIALSGAVLAFAAALGTVGCLVTAFDLPLADPGHLIPVWVGFALISAGACSFRHGGIVLLCLLALLSGYLWQDGTAAEQTVQLLCRISAIYDRAYGWGMLELSGELWNDAVADLPMAILGAAIAILVCRCVCRRSRVWPGVLSCVIPLLSCIVVTDTVPGEGYLLLIMAVLALLILSASVRQENALQGLRLTAYAALPVVLALIVLFLAVPQEGYVNHSKALQEQLLKDLEALPQKVEAGVVRLAADIRGGEPQQVDLESVGPRIPFTYPVMEVTAGESGTLYLRGQDYDSYDGLGWSATSNRTESFSLEGRVRDAVTIRTRSAIGTKYLPYYPGEAFSLLGGSAENPGKLQEYTIARSSLPDDWRLTAYTSQDADHSEETPELSRYLALPDETRNQARALIGELLPNGSNTEKADIIAAFVTNSARYDLDTPRMPEGEADFALWFLEEGETGYCIHFATAATVLLRAADVPARYVTGYMAEVTGGDAVTITEENAHAWAEYYEPRLHCWIPLEATPAAQALPESPQTRPTEPETAPAPQTTESVPPTTVSEATTETTEIATEETLAATPTVSDTPLPPEPEEKETPWFALLLIPLLALFAVTQRTLRLEFRRSRQRTGSPNAQALARWQEAVLLSRLLKDSPTEELMVLVQKAKFSQHQLTAEELQRFDSYIRSCHRRLKEKNLLWQVVYRYVYAVY